jgi:4-hydroxythreonine-4-phosphate dehydrogenase
LSDSPRDANTRIIAVTSGEPAGIGPEIVCRLFSKFTPTDSIAVLIGAQKVFESWLARAGVSFPVVESIEAVAREAGRIYILHTDVDDDYPISEDSVGGGRHSGRAIELACELAKNHSVHGIVTAPISKKSLQLANFPFPGHTEMLARYLNAPNCQMMMVYDNFRVVPLTRHLPLRAVSEQITTDSIMTCVRETAKALAVDFEISAPRIGVAGLNPHAGDAGVFGDEELDVIIPAIERLCAEGIDVTGPLAGDGLFPLALKDLHSAAGDASKRGRFDAYISMYHDQGLVPFKTLAQRRGVNVTVGLPVVRTSVDHGVAYDIAAQGIAETKSLRRAYKLAEEICIRRTRATAGPSKGQTQV